MNLTGKLIEKGLLAPFNEGNWLGQRAYYLCGPMSGYPEWNFPIFRAAAARIRMFGHLVVSPAEMDEAAGFDAATGAGLETMRDYMKRDLPALLACDAVAVLAGWEQSKGAQLEVHVARACGIPVVDAETLRPLSEAKPETILQEAQRLVYGDRARQYAHPRVHFARTVGMLNALGFRRDGRRLTEQDWPDVLIADKLARRANDSGHRDSLVDIAGYAATAERLSEDAEA